MAPVPGREAMTIRSFEEQDYPAWVEVSNAVWPRLPCTESEVRYRDQHRDAKCVHQKMVANRAGDRRLAGWAVLGQDSWSYHPRRFWTEIAVPPDLRGQGIGRALFREVLLRLGPREPLLLRTATQESEPRAIRFLVERGFQEARREWESRLDPREFDFRPYAGAAGRVAAQGVEIRTAAELLAEDAGALRRLYEVLCDLEREVPRLDPEYTPPDFESWRRRREASPNWLPEAEFVAVHEGRFVGVSQLSRMQASPDLDTGLTAVLPEYRRRGIALALKLRAVEYARRTGVPAIRTWNESRNRGMLSINERLGFVKEPAWIQFEKSFSSPPAAHPVSMESLKPSAE